ncbi:uncharacterized protein LOC115770286 [Drosophila novamexicana]|uniref:uncharacterized protein LOC115770286 n=1 Tax=Drosophila novamexicana TaxID=47314 RepID=UPI0011E5AC22|nr:uncharacterized protein LOC115770286 [Drosophila novamexicana]
MKIMLSNKTLHKFLLPLLLLMLASVWSQPLNKQPETEGSVAQRPVFLIENNVNAEDAKNYQITIPKEVKPGEPCLTISWKTNPDGSGPDDPRIYMVDGYFKIMPATANKQQ